MNVEMERAESRFFAIGHDGHFWGTVSEEIAQWRWIYQSIFAHWLKTQWIQCGE